MRTAKDLSNNIVSTIVTGGIFSALGAVGAAIVQTVNGRYESRAKAADLIAGAAGSLADRLTTMNERLEEDNQKLREVVDVLVDSVSLLLDHANDLPENVRQAAHEALSAAKGKL